MRTLSPAATGHRTSTRSAMIATGLATALVLSACGSGDDSATEEQGASPSPSVSASATPTETATPSSTPSNTQSSAEATETPADEPEGRKTAAAPEQGGDSQNQQQPPQPERTAHAPELGMRPAPAFPPPNMEGQPNVVPCNGAQMSGTITPQQQTAQGTVAALTVTNSGQGPCVLYGNADLVYVDSAGNVLGAPSTRTPATGAGAVSLQPGESSTARMRITPPETVGQACNPARAQGVLVYLPNSPNPLRVDYSTQACGNPKVKQLEVLPFGM